MKIAIYARVSTNQQHTDTQMIQLREYAKARGWQIHKEYIDEGISGSKCSRPALDVLMVDARKRRFDCVMVWKFDRFARSTSQLLRSLNEFRILGIQFCSYTEAMDTSTPMGEAIFTIIAALAQFERDLIVERTKAGLDRARKQGKRLGPPIKVTHPERIRELRKSMSVRQVAQEMNLSVMTVYNYLKLVPIQE